MRILIIGMLATLTWGIGLIIHGSPARAQDVTESLQGGYSPLMYSTCEEGLPNLRLNHEIGSPIAASMLGQLYENGHCVRRDIGRAAALYAEGAAQNYEGAQMLLGRLHVLGQGVPKDLERARQLFRLAALTLARIGIRDYHGMAMFHLWSGDVPRLLVEELSPYQEMADGPPERQYEFALRWREGQGLPKSREAYLSWLVMAALGGLPPARYELGLARLAGEIGMLGAFDGAEWIWDAARADYLPAQLDLARRFEGGNGTQPSAVQALAWYLIAQRNGAEVSEAIERLDSLLSEGERQVARRRSLNRILLSSPSPLEGTPMPPLLRP